MTDKDLDDFDIRTLWWLLTTQKWDWYIRYDVMFGPYYFYYDGFHTGFNFGLIGVHIHN